MDQARYYVCESCMTPVPSGHKFCGRCGAPVPDTMLHQPVEFYSDMQDPSKARLILIRGEGMDGLSLPPEGRPAHRRARGPGRVSRRPVRFAEARELLLSRRSPRRARRGLAERRLLPHPRHGRDRARRHVPRRRAALPARSHTEGVRRRRSGRHLLLFVAEVPERVSPESDARRRRRRHDRLHARHEHPDRARGRRSQLPGGSSSCPPATARSKSARDATLSPTSTAETARTCASRPSAR